MSTSGTVVGNDVTVSGGGNAGNHIFTNWQLASQNTGGNYSTINWQTYFHFNGDDAQLDNGNTGSSAGTLWANGGRVYNFSSNFSTRDLGLASGSFNIGHDGNGNCNMNINNSIVVFQSGTSSGSANWDLPQIPRYANIDGFNINQTTDEWIEFAWHADRSCDYISWWSNAYDGGGHHDIPTSGQGWWTIDLHNLVSGKQYDITVAVRNAASGLWTNSGTQNPTTKTQNNLVGRRVL